MAERTTRWRRVPDYVSAVVVEVEAIRHRYAVVHFGREDGGIVTGCVAEVLRPGVVQLKQQAMAECFIELCL